LVKTTGALEICGEFLEKGFAKRCDVAKLRERNLMPAGADNSKAVRCVRKLQLLWTTT